MNSGSRIGWRIVSRLLGSISLTFIVCTIGSAQQTVAFSGVVVDSAGAVIAHATIDLVAEHSNIHASCEGKFAITIASEDVRSAILTVSAPSFSSTRIRLSDVPPGSPLEIRLLPSTLIERISVVANKESTSQTAVALAVDSAGIDRSGAVTIDDALRQVPGFSLFRRSGSLTANPTSQGVSLRGVGANGASRAVVLVDGVPVNNPFGGWVYWNRIPREAISSVSITNGAASDTYGAGALGGVINIETKQLERSFFDAETSFGGANTSSSSATGGFLFHTIGITAAVGGLRTNGYVLVPQDQRGLVDTAAGTADINGALTLSHSTRAGGRAFLRLNSFGENRENGTPLQVNDTRISSMDLVIDRETPIGILSLRAFGSHEIFNQNFSAVSLDRNSESLTNRQRNPSQQLGVAFQWRRAFARRHLIEAGFEARDIRGHSAENTFNASRITAHVDAGGQQRMFAFFGQDSLTAAKWIFGFGGRIDRWTNSGGFSNRIPVSGSVSLVSFAPRAETAFSPRLSIARRFASSVWFTGSAYKAFRAPTLNELYRNFRVGNIVTNANSNLRAEHLTGGEAGLNVQKFGERLMMRVDLFWSQIVDPVANVTLTSTPALITRQRQNLGAIRARGFEAAAAFRATARLTISTSYLLTDSTVRHFPASRALEGLLVPQIPKHQFNIQVDFHQAKWRAGVQGRFVGTAFDDDLNLLPLRPFFTVDAECSRTLARKVDLFVAFQNLTNTRYQVARSPVGNVGPPAIGRVGLRFHLRD